MRIFEILLIVLFRFRPIPRIWAGTLILVNLGALLFLNTHYGWVSLGATSAGATLMAFIYLKLGFVRLLGVGHIFWIPMIAYFLFLLPDKSANPFLYIWVITLVAFNSISLLVDIIDVSRFLRGERSPYYQW